MESRFSAAFVPRLLAAEFASIARDLAEPTFVSLPIPSEMRRNLEEAGSVEILRNATVAWRPPGQPAVLAGFGRELSFQGERNSILADAAIALRTSLATPRADSGPAVTRPAFFGGARFAPGSTHDPAWDAFGGWYFVMPRILLALTGDSIEGSVTLRLDPGTTEEDIALRLSGCLDEMPSGCLDTRFRVPETAPEPWQGAVQDALDEIAQGQYEKVVLARLARVEQPCTIDQGSVLTRLLSRFDGCHVFKLAMGGSAWTGASPELLCQAKDGAISTVALAGSRPRGTDPESDAALAQRLVGSAKEQHEHALVVTALREGLAPFSHDLSIPEAPQVLRTATIQHLRTPICGRLNEDTTILDVLAALHPSPAVGGWPRPRAMQSIERLEGMDRGWYAGPIGRLGLDGDGEFAVALRSGLIRGNAAQLYAGAGIVCGSNPAREFAETETKLRAMVEAIRES